ncbi:MAG: hypothetical protein R3266_05365 [Gemmatimonadota bacterium]|nr:hypothetical protein [Gemmatimonadota bacterium]
MRRAGLAACLAFGAAACSNDGDIVGPPPGNQAFSPEAVANSIFSLRFAGDNAVVVQVGTISSALGLSASRTAGSSDRLSLSVARASRAKPARGQVDRLSLLRTFPPRGLQDLVANRAAAAARGQSVPLFPINFLGKTFVFDAGIDAYVELGDGGPANGVRFELYVVDLESGLPALPLSPVGFVDLIDLSDAVSTRLRVRAFDTQGGGQTPLADYVVDGAFSSTSTGVAVSLLSEGFAIDQNGRFDFDLDELLESDDAAGLTAVSSVHRVVSDEGTDVRLEVEGDIANDGSHSDLFFRMDIDGSAGLTLVDLAVVDGDQNGDIRHNGTLEVIVGGTVESPTFAAAAGPPFSISERAALDEILFGIDDVLFFASELFIPLADLFGVG